MTTRFSDHIYTPEEEAVALRADCRELRRLIREGYARRAAAQVAPDPDASVPSNDLKEEKDL